MKKKMDLTKDSPEIAQEKLESFKKLFPEAISEGKIDVEALRRTIGENVAAADERYTLNWAGKTEAFKALQTSTTATLAPCQAESVDFEKTGNVFIEGENLEVLKVLQKAYYGKIKMIYIDPPYNTGSDSFIYPDRFQETKEEYLKRIEEKDEEGYLLKEGLFQKNSKEGGHYHSNWLSMMYPRLFLARNLLREDGVIFVSIDDNEVHNLRLLMNEVFGEENFEGQIHWRRRHNQPNDKTKMIGLVAEHIIAYSKSHETFKESGVGKVDLTGEFSNPDNDLRGEWASKPWKVGSDQSGSRYKITTPSGKVLDEEWMGDDKTYLALVKDKRIVFPKKGDGFPRKKYFKFEREKEGQCATNWWDCTDFGHNQGANDTMTDLFGVKNVFDNPKPMELVRGLVQISNAKSGDLVMDFFAGSCVLAHSVYQIDAESKTDIKYICVQIPELVNENEEAFKAGYKTISEIGKERIRRVIKRMKADVAAQKTDLGYKVFKLKSSNLKIWRGDVVDTAEDLERQLDLLKDPVKPSALEQNLLWEFMLKSGYDLNTPIEEQKVGGCKFYVVAGGEMAVIVSTADAKCLQEIIKRKPQKVVCLDSIFEGNDQLKTNTVLQMKDAEIEFRTI